MKVSVITDAVSPESYFPAWHSYYGRLFGEDNIHVFTYLRNRDAFHSFSVGGIHSLLDAYNDDLRKDAMTAFVADLLDSHDMVVRVDVDEFLVPDPAKFANLYEYLESWSGTHLTAFGFDILQSPEEPVLDLGRPILTQRRFGYALTALNKTCVTRVPLKWGRGFHYCSQPPNFGDLFLFHAKRADIALQAIWNERMRAEARGDQFVDSYYSWDMVKIQEYHESRLRLPLITGPDALVRTDFNRHFLDNIRYVEKLGLFNGPYDIEQVNVVIPDTFRNAS